MPTRRTRANKKKRDKARQAAFEKMQESSFDPSRNLETFHPFERLPFELRIAIWALSLESRVITQSDDAANIPKQKFSRVPPILHVCHESRKEFLDVDGSGAKRVHPTYRYVEKILYPVYIAVKLDVIYMLSKFYPDMLPVGKITNHKLLLPNLAPEIRHVAIEFSEREMQFRQGYYTRDGARLPFFDNSIAKFPNLKTLTVSINYQWWYSAYSGYQPAVQQHATEDEKAEYRKKYAGRLGGFVEWVRAAEREMKDHLPQFEELVVSVPTMSEFRMQEGLEFWTANVYDTGKNKAWRHGVVVDPADDYSLGDEEQSDDQDEGRSEEMNFEFGNFGDASRGYRAGHFAGSSSSDVSDCGYSGLKYWDRE